VQVLPIEGYATLFVGEPKIKAHANKTRFVGDTLNSFTSQAQLQTDRSNDKITMANIVFFI